MEGLSLTEEAQWLLDWFMQRGEVPGNTPEKQLEVNFFAEKLIDSLEVIELIMEIESHFGVAFSELHFQDRRFSTIGGLSVLVAELCNQH